MRPDGCFVTCGHTTEQVNPEQRLHVLVITRRLQHECLSLPPPQVTSLPHHRLLPTSYTAPQPTRFPDANGFRKVAPLSCYENWVNKRNRVGGSWVPLTVGVIAGGQTARCSAMSAA